MELFLTNFYKFRLGDCTSCGFLYWFVRKTVLLPQILIATLFPSYKAGRKSKILFVKPGSVVKNLWNLHCLCKKCPRPLPRVGPGPGALPPLGGSTSPRSSPALLPNLGSGRWEGGDGPPETLHGLSSLQVYVVICLAAWSASIVHLVCQIPLAWSSYSWLPDLRGFLKVCSLYL